MTWSIFCVPYLVESGANRFPQIPRGGSGYVPDVRDLIPIFQVRLHALCSILT